MDEVTPAELLAYASHVDRVAAIEADKLQQLSSYLEDCQRMSKLVGSLSDKLQHKVFVPFGSLAFMPGQLVHTNELSVHIGAGYHVQRSVKDTAEILARREAFLSQQVQRQQRQLQSIQTRNNLQGEAFRTEAGDEVVDIRQQLDESDALLSQATTQRIQSPRPMTDEAEEIEFARFMNRLDSLERQEQAGDQDGEGATRDENFSHIMGEEQIHDEDEDQESEPDSDDEVAYMPVQVPVLPAALFPKPAAAASATPAAAAAAAAAVPAAAPASTSAAINSKPTFKKGFLLSRSAVQPRPAVQHPPPAATHQHAGAPASTPASSSSNTTPSRANSASTSTAVSPASRAAARSTPPAAIAAAQTPSAELAFTGQVVERAGGMPSELVAPAATPQPTSSTRTSKFKQRLQASQ